MLTLAETPYRVVDELRVPTSDEQAVEALLRSLQVQQPPVDPSGQTTDRPSRRRTHKRRLRALKRRIGYVPRGNEGQVLDHVDYALTDRQHQVFESRARFRVLIAGRRFGKTFLACVELITAAAERPGSLCWYVGPTYRMAKDLAWEILKALVPASLLRGKPNESTLTIKLRNGSVIQLKGAEKWDRLRGRTLWFVVLDEFPLQNVKVWDEAIRPSLATTRGGALFIGTPMGFNWGYDFYRHGKDPDRPRWESWQFTTAEGGLVEEAELEEAKATMDGRLYRQEFHASFESLSGRIYLNFDLKLHEDASVEDLGGDIFVGIDFNVNPMTAVIAVRVKDECHVLDAIEILSSNTTELAEELNRRYPRQVPHPTKRDPRTRQPEMVPGRRIVACPDPAGRARSTKAVAGETDFTILQRAGFIVQAPDKAPLWKDRINNTNAMLRDAAGRSRTRIHPRAKPLLKALAGYTYKEGTSLPDKTGLEHVTDAFGYLLWQQFNLWLTYSRSQHFSV